MTIQEAAEQYAKEQNSYGDSAIVPVYTKYVTHYESLMRAAGYEWVKTEEWIRLHGELAGANEYIKLLEENLMRGMVKIDYEQREMEKPSPLPEQKKWVSVSDGYPQDGQRCWFISKKYDSITLGRYFKEDHFKRKDVFIGNTGGHFTDVTKYMIVDIPDKPSPDNDNINLTFQGNE